MKISLIKNPVKAIFLSFLASILLGANTTAISGPKDHPGKAHGKNKVTVCHLSASGKFVKLEIPLKAALGHLEHHGHEGGGDFLIMNGQECTATPVCDIGDGSPTDIMLALLGPSIFGGNIYDQCRLSFETDASGQQVFIAVDTQSNGSERTFEGTRAMFETSFSLLGSTQPAACFEALNCPDGP